MKNIVLVGFMGTGKTSAGRLLAKSLDRKFLELDELIEKKENMTVADIFEKKGEPYFRNIEKEVIKDACKAENVVISAGGGAVMDEENFNNLKNNGFIICLEASPDIILERTKGLKTRPLLNVPNPSQKIRELLERRKPYYKKADYCINTDGLTVEQVVEKIIKKAEAEPRL